MILFDTCFTEAWRWPILHIVYKVHPNLKAVCSTGHIGANRILLTKTHVRGGYGLKYFVSNCFQHIVREGPMPLGSYTSKRHAGSSPPSLDSSILSYQQKIKCDRLHAARLLIVNAPWLLTKTQKSWNVFYVSWCFCCTRGKPSTNIGQYCQTFDLDRTFDREIKARTIFNLWPWPTTLTYNPRLAKVKVVRMLAFARHPVGWWLELFWFGS